MDPGTNKQAGSSQSAQRAWAEKQGWWHQAGTFSPGWAP